MNLSDLVCAHMLDEKEGESDGGYCPKVHQGRRKINMVLHKAYSRA